ncbi:MAG: response regulator [Solobacterium sp.]|nr:response regulator [Solobacterium sp.]
MKLLIVDDQLATLSGLEKGIDWKAAGFTEVDTAQNAMEARISFARKVPDLMLCDIEMPVESGIDLSTWVRDQGYQTKIIFLTCHSDFAYAQEAIRLQVSDYIVQPAPYHRIREKAEKVVAAIAEESSRSAMMDIGRTYSSNQQEITSSLFRGFMMKTVTEQALSGLPGFPDPSRMCWLVLLQYVQQTEKIREWSEQGLVLVMRNTVRDVFDKKKYSAAVAMMEPKTFALTVQPVEGQKLDRDTLIQLLHYLENMFDMYMPCSIAYYVSGPHAFKHLPEEWTRMIQLRNRNVTGRKGLFVEQNEEAESEYKEQYYRWNMLLKNSGGQAMEKDAFDTLRSYAETGKLTQNIMVAVYRDVTRLILSLGQDIDIQKILQNGGSDTLYANALYSKEAMEELIHTIAMVYDQGNKEENSKSIVSTIKDYIDEHLSENIRKEDLTDLMHLNEDYLTRLFKKETGMSIKAYIIQRKMYAARELLQTTSLSVSSVAIQMGYSNFSHFAASYKKEFGITPAEEKKK